MIRNWWINSSLSALADAELRLVSLLDLKRYDTPVGEDLHIHTLEGGQKQEGKAPLVLCHGYGQGAAAFFLNLPQLTQNVSKQLYFINCKCPIPSL